jgi:hypothetical protein
MDVKNDPKNCGTCGNVCALGTACVAGKCGTACRTAAPNVLFYGPTGSSEQPYLPVGATVTVATEATWRAMTKADFSRYDMIVIGSDGGGALPTATLFQAAYDTRFAWGPAITGRIALLGTDPGYHAKFGTAGAITFLRATLKWLGGGPTGSTSLYVTSDGSRALDFMGAIGTISSSVQNTDIVTVTSPSHPIMIGSSSASMSSWTISNHTAISAPSPFVTVETATVTTGSTLPSIVVREATSACTP